MMLVLLVIILRICSIEFRSKQAGTGWRKLWDAVFFPRPLALALLLGVALGNILNGLPIDPSGDMCITLLEMLNPFALLVGVTTVVMLGCPRRHLPGDAHRGRAAETGQESHPHADAGHRCTGGARAGCHGCLPLASGDNYQTYIWPLIFPLGALVALVVAWRMSQRGQYVKAFVASAAMIALLVITAAAGMYPNMLISSTAPPST